LAAAGIGGAGNPLAVSPFPPGQVPGFFIETYRVPPFLLPIYESAAARYGVPWEVLAGINEVETNYGNDLSVSSAGAEGWMQFLPQTWAEYGVDATGKGVRDPYNPADAIFAAARYLRAAGAAQSLSGAIFAYNHSSLYVESVMLRARLLAGIPPALLTALTALGRGDKQAGASARLAPSPRAAAAGEDASASGLAPAQWHELLARIAQLPQPHVAQTPTSASLPDRPGGVDLPPAPQGESPALDIAPQQTGATPSASATAHASQVSGGLSFQPQLGLPASSVNMIGAAPQEAPGAVWATGVIGSVPAQAGAKQLSQATVLLRHDAHTAAWQIVPVQDEHGVALPFSATPSVTAAGGIVMLSSESDEHGAQQETLITRDPGGPFVQASLPPSSGPGAVLAAGETLYPAPGSADAPIFTAIDDAGHTGALDAGHTGALVVPAATATVAVVHYDGVHWTREQICTQYTAGTCSDSASDLKVLAIAASSAQNAWMLASSAGEPLMLFKRTPAASGAPVWVQSQPASWAPAAGDGVFARHGGQMLTVTNQGIWVDAALTTPAAPNEMADFSLLLDATTPSTVLGTWCFPQVACGSGSLGAPLPPDYRSFAWPGSAGEEGTRIVAGLEDGALLRFQSSGDFSYLVGGGGNASLDAAFVSPEEGWISAVAGAGGNSAQVEHVTRSPAPSALQSWPLPFRRPLMAIATQPGSTPGDPGAQAIAVGDQGQIARYLPGEGWTREFLYKASGAVATPRLRGAAWPEAGRAYAVGDEGAMWVWRSDTGLWEPDPAAPLNFHANLTGIAFSPLNPALGYAVGKQGTLLSYDKTWTQQALPEGLGQVNFTSIAFAGGEALATYRTVDAAGGETGGLIVNEGSGWRVDASAQTLLAGLPDPHASVLSKVAGLPDGGAVAAGPGVVIERDSASAPWRFSSQPLPDAQNIAALAAIRSGSSVQALVSVDLAEISNPNNLNNFIFNIDNPVSPGFGQPGLVIAPDPLPVSGYLLRETAEGWQDVEGQAYPNVPSITNTDLPNWPDAVLALDVDPSGSRGWAVGGQTGGIVEQSHISGAQFTSQSAAALRLGGDLALPQSEGAPIPTPAGQVTFALGGNAQCAGPCADFANEGVGPDAWLSSALARATGISGLRAFLYSGARVAGGAARQLSSVPGGFAREQSAYRGDLQAAGSLPVYVAPSPSDADAGGGLATFAAAMGNDAPVGSAPAGTPVPPAGSGAYAFESAGNGGAVRVIVLDFSGGTLGAGALGWLAEQLTQASTAAHIPAVVMGNADIVEANASNYDAQDAAALRGVLLSGGASAYLFDSIGENRSEQIGAGAAAIPALGSGTLGYVPPSPLPEEFLGASGFVLASVNVAARDPRSNRAPVSATLVPSISQLAVDPTDGTLLRRSQVALFRGLARRPAGGLELAGGTGSSGDVAPDPYVPIPETCIGSACAQFIAPAYTFTSSHPDVGNFVEQEPSNPNPRAVALTAAGKPIPDPHSGLFCAFNAGTTTISITTGGLTYSQQITVQAGSVQQPCGTVPLINPPAREVSAVAPVASLPPASQPPGSPAPLTLVPPPPPAPLPVISPPHLPAHPAPPAPFFFSPPPTVPLLAAVLPPPPVLARPTPPSGTSPVTVVSPATAPKEEREDEEAIESARANMAAYIPEDPFLPPRSLLALIVIAAGAGAGIRRSSKGRRRRGVPAYVSTLTWRHRQ
jgi:soluble lytic murein transglycosylase-like protein